MAFLMCDSFDMYNTVGEILAKWRVVLQGTGTFISIGSPGRSGSGNYLSLANGNGNQTYCAYPVGGLSSVVICSAVFPVNSSLHAPNLSMYTFVDVNGVQMAWLVIRADLSIALTISNPAIPGGTFTAISAPNVVVLQSWNFIECTISFATGATGTLLVKSNGATVLNVSSIITSATTTSVFNLGPCVCDADTNLFDDIYILSTSGGSPTASLGDCKVVALMPNGAGRLTQFSKFGAATNFQAVNEVPPDGDTSYVFDATTNIVDCYTLPVPPNVLSLLAVQPVAYARKDETPSKVLTLGVGNGSTESYDAGHGLTQSYVYYLDPLGSNPLTSAPWAAVDLNTLQYAMKVTT